MDFSFKGVLGLVLCTAVFRMSSGQELVTNCSSNGYTDGALGDVLCQLDRSYYTTSCGLQPTQVQFVFYSPAGVRSIYCVASFSSFPSAGTATECPSCSCSSDATGSEYTLTFTPDSTVHYNGRFECEVDCFSGTPTADHSSCNPIPLPSPPTTTPPDVFCIVIIIKTPDLEIIFTLDGKTIRSTQTATTTTTTTTLSPTSPPTSVDIDYCILKEGPHKGSNVSASNILKIESGETINFYCDCCDAWVKVLIVIGWHLGSSTVSVCICIVVDYKRSRGFFKKAKSKHQSTNNDTGTPNATTANTTSNTSAEEDKWTVWDWVFFIVLILVSMVVYIIYAAIRNKWPFEPAATASSNSSTTTPTAAHTTTPSTKKSKRNEKIYGQKLQILVFILGGMLAIVWFTVYTTIAGVCGHWPFEKCACDCPDTSLPTTTTTTTTTTAAATTTSSPDIGNCPGNHNFGGDEWELPVGCIGFVLIAVWTIHGGVTVVFKFWPCDRDEIENPDGEEMKPVTNNPRPGANRPPNANSARASEHTNDVASSPDKQKKASRKVESEHTHSENRSKKSKPVSEPEVQLDKVSESSADHGVTAHTRPSATSKHKLPPVERVSRELPLPTNAATGTPRVLGPLPGIESK